jgi:hypothetical protein
MRQWRIMLIDRRTEAAAVVVAVMEAENISPLQAKLAKMKDG